MNKIITILLALISLLSLAMFLSISFIRWPFTDDFGFYVFLQSDNLFKVLFDKYMNWDARFFMPFSIIWFAAFKFLNFDILLVLSSLSFIGISYILIAIITDGFNLPLSKTNKVLFTALMNGVLFVLLYHVHSSFTYWVTGSSYVHSLFIALYWLRTYNKNERKSILFYMFSFGVATMSQNITVGLAAIVFIDWLSNYNRQSASYYKYLTLIFAVGILLATFSPGSFKQLAYMQSNSYTSSLNASPTIKDYVIHFFKLYTEALKPNILFYLVFPLLIIPIMWGIVKNASVSLNTTFWTFNKINRASIVNFLKGYKYYIASVFSLAVYWPTQLYGDRYYVGFYVFLLIALLFSFLKIVKIEDLKNYSPTKNYFAYVVLMLFLFLYYNKTYQESVIVHKFMKQREVLLEKNKGVKKITLPVLDFDEFSRSVRTPEITNDPSCFSNATMAMYYNIDSIFAGKVVPKAELK
jgi:hypothetical protein